jgi:hypothetical protein
MFATILSLVLLTEYTSSGLPVVPTTADTGKPTSLCDCQSCECSKCACGMASKPKPQAPTKHQLTDVYGQTWEHEDAAWLAQWVAQRNATVRYYTVSACASGRCPR